MDLRQARTFVNVVEIGTVSGAAARLRIAQPALSRQISAMEQEFGFKLFDRVGRRLVLTSQGNQLLHDCRVLVGHADTLRERAHLLRVGKTGVLKVAASPQFIEGAISTFLHRYAERYPDVELKLREAIGWAEIREMLERGDIDLGQNLAHAEPNDRRFGCHPLGEVDLLAAWQAGKPFGEGSAISIEGIAGKPLLVLDASYIFRRTFDAACRLAKVEPNIVFESRTPHALLAMVESGHGIAVIPSKLRTHRHSLRIASVTYRGMALREPLAISWN
jgi:DNA-binding transcriptional LysR family regulator